MSYHVPLSFVTACVHWLRWGVRVLSAAPPGESTPSLSDQDNTRVSQRVTCQGNGKASARKLRILTDGHPGSWRVQVAQSVFGQNSGLRQGRVRSTMALLWSP